MNLQDRIDNYKAETKYPQSLFIGEDGRIVGTWIMGQNYQTYTNYYGCLEPSALVLTANLDWIRMDSIKAGDKLVGFSENIENLNQRILNETTVERIGEVELDGVDIELENGIKFNCSQDHLWLCNNSKKDKNKIKRTKWIKAGDINIGDSIRKLCDVWENCDNFELGWLSGILDGEGHQDINSGTRIGITQRTGVVSDKIENILNKFNIPYTIKNRKRNQNGKIREINDITINGITNCIKLLGLTKPHRLSKAWIDKRLNKKDVYLKVVSIKKTGKRKYIGMDTTTKTFIAYGLCSHNSYPAGYLKRVKALFPDKKNILHLFSGKVDTKLMPGKTVDINPNNDADYVDDAQTLENVPVEQFDLVCADPPYSVEDCDHYQTTMIKRNKVMAALGKKLKKGAHIVWLDQVLPMYRKDQFKIVGVIGMVKSTNHRFRVVTIFEKT